MIEKSLLKISEVATEAKVLPSTIRHYTDLGLIKAAGSTDGGHRLYAAAETLDALAKIQAFTKRGMTLPEIKAQMDKKAVVKKVLVIDDEPEVGDFMTELFRVKFPGWQLKVVTDGFEAGRTITEFDPNLVLLDIMLPGVDGFKICEMIKKDVLLKGVTVLAMTGYAAADLRDRIFRAGANDFIAKPMDNKELVNKVKKLMGIDPENKVNAA